MPKIKISFCTIIGNIALTMFIRVKRTRINIYIGIKFLYSAAQVQDSIFLNESNINVHDKTAFIFGNEVTGVEESTLALCDGCIEIPQYGMKHSLNIATAAGVVFWEIVRNRV